MMLTLAAALVATVGFVVCLPFLIVMGINLDELFKVKVKL